MSDTIDNFHKEWRELILTKLVKMEGDLTHLNNQVTDLRIAQVTAKDVDSLSNVISHQNETISTQGRRIEMLEQAKTQLWTIFITVQVIIGLAWSVLLFFKK